MTNQHLGCSSNTDIAGRQTGWSYTQRAYQIRGRRVHLSIRRTVFISRTLLIQTTTKATAQRNKDGVVNCHHHVARACPAPRSVGGSNNCTKRRRAWMRLSVYPSIRRRQQGMGWGQLTLAIRFVEGGAVAKAQDDDDEANFVNREL